MDDRTVALERHASATGKRPKEGMNGSAMVILLTELVNFQDFTVWVVVFVNSYRN
jgi:hypothetical protein